MILTALIITLIHYAPAFLISSSKEVSGIGKAAWFVAALLPALFHKQLSIIEGTSMTISVISLVLAWGIYLTFKFRTRAAIS